jgi:hypothetical protein
VTVSNSTLSGNVGDLGGGGIYNDSNGTTSVKNSSTIAGNGDEDVLNSGVLYLDSTSTIGILEGNPALPL